MNIFAQHTKRFGLEWLAVGVLLAAIGAAIIVAIYRDFERTEVMESDRLQGQVRVVEESLIRQLEGMNHALAGVRSGLNDLHGAESGAATSAKLKLLGSAMPGVRTLAVLDAHGTIVASSRDELLGKNFRQREYFDGPRRSPNPGMLYVSAPIQSSLGKFVIIVSRAVTSASGEFAGVVSATLDPDYFGVVLRSVLYAPDMRTTLVHADGKVFLEMPPNEHVLGSNMDVPGSLFSRHVEGGLSPTFATDRMVAADEERMVAMRTVNRADLQMSRPLVAIASRDLSTVFATWRTKASRHAVFFAVVFLAMVPGLHFSQRRRRVLARLEQAAANERQRTDAELARTADLLRGSEERLRQVTDHLPVLVSSLDVDQRFRFANRAYVDWFDIEPASLIGRKLSEVYGEGSYERFRHHIDAALSGQTVSYERDMATPHGMRHVEVTLVPQRGGDGMVHGLHGLIMDLTARQQAELQRKRSEERLSLALEGSGLALFDWDIVEDRIYQSAQAAAMRGEAALETTVSSRELPAFVHPDDLEVMLGRIKGALSGATPAYHAEYRVRRHSGAWLWIRARGRVVERDAAGRPLRLAGTYADINERKMSEQRLRHLAEFDMLTDLPNRVQFLDRLQHAMARSTPASPMALLFLDIDHFKTVNDTLGHQAGDQLLKVFAQRMRASVRQSDMVARLSGDEFTVVVEGLRDRGDAKVLANKLVESLSEPIALAGKTFQVTTSVGVAICLAGESDGEELLRRADLALYEAKRQGRNGFFCDETDLEGGLHSVATGSPSALVH